MPAADRSRWASSRARELDPWREHDACGVGFVARASGHRSADIARLALQALARVAHRGAAATDRSGDGAGLLTQIPAPLFYREAASRGIALAPAQPFAVGAFFLPREHDALGCATSIIEEVLRGEGLPVLGWRDVPLDVVELAAGSALPDARAQRRDQYPVGEPKRDAGPRARAGRTALERGGGPAQARHLVGGKRLGQPGQRARAAGALGTRPGTRPDDARSRGPRRRRGDGARVAGIL